MFPKPLPPRQRFCIFTIPILLLLAMKSTFFGVTASVLSLFLFTGCGEFNSGNSTIIPPIKITPELYHKSERVCGDLNSDSITIDILSFRLDSLPNSLLADSVRAFIDQFVFATDSIGILEADPDSLFSHFAGKWHNTMIYYEGPCQGWTISRKAEPLLNNAGLFSLSVIDFSYMGGAHPNTRIWLKTFDLITGKSIDIRQIVNKNQQESFLKKVEMSFRQVHELSDTASWSYNGFWFDDGFRLPQNMALTPNGLYLLYNQYEVAPYAFGTTELLIPIDELLPFLTPEWRDRVASVR